MMGKILIRYSPIEVQQLAPENDDWKLDDDPFLLVKVYIFSSGYVSFGEGRTAGSWMTWFGMKIRQSLGLPKDGIIVWCSTIRP